MKRCILLVLVLMIAMPVYAVDITVTLTDEEYKAVSVMTVTPEEWVQHAVSNKARKMIDVLVKDYSDKQPEKISQSDKDIVINSIDIEKEKDKRRGKKK